MSLYNQIEQSFFFTLSRKIFGNLSFLFAFQLITLFWLYAELTEDKQEELLNAYFSDDGINAIANIASEVNATVENIGARRLHTIIEKILDEISFTATDRAGEKIIINKEYINKNLDNLVKDTDLSKFIL